ncbi:hypothetical protein [Acidocella sp.]|uniref:hypothetical protein n=1 Tax=Acidocella sp. TaxID=50710 RepID=UPI0026363B0B|nr:hypothetical protein [Acidocella sp.]
MNLKIYGLLISGSFFIPSFVYAQKIYSVQSPTGYYILPGQMGKKGKPYGPTFPPEKANWNIGQWGTPLDLPSFNDQNVSANQWAKVIFSPSGLKLSQNAQNFSCMRIYPSGRKMAAEWALFEGPNNQAYKDLPRAMPSANLALSDLEQVRLHVTISLDTLKLTDHLCSINKAFIVEGFVLVNTFSHQTLFYSVGTFLLGSGNTLSSYQIVRPANEDRTHGGITYFKGENMETGAKHVFGYSVPISEAFGAPELEVGKTITYNLNVLPSLIKTIRSINNLDQNLDHWTLRSFFQGQTIAGHIIITSTWQNTKLDLYSKI